MQKQITAKQEELNKIPVSTPLTNCSICDCIVTTNLENNSDPIDNSMFFLPLGSGYNKDNFVSMSCQERIFVISYWNNPLTPCKKSKARKLLFGGVAKVIWNKFGQFGIQMLIPTRKETPKTILGIDFGTKFEGYSVTTLEQNNFNVMWSLPNKKTITKKLEERRHLRRSRRWRNCGRREARFNNRSRKDFIAPNQLVIVNSRLKAIKEFFKSYPISKVAIEDVKFNHRDKHYGKNFTTIEIGKKKIYDFISDIIGRENLILFEGFETKEERENLGLKKSSNKDAEHFYTHCVDSFALTQKLLEEKVRNLNEKIIVVDDTYRPVRRRLHDTQFKKGGIREKYSTGNFKGIRKGTICEFGQIVGGTKNSVFIRNSNNKRIGKDVKKISWLSKHFKIKQEIAISLTNKLVAMIL
jgi:hypothetical protein